MKRRTKLMAAGSVALATGAIVSGAVVTSNAMASSEAPPAKVTVGVVSAVSAAASPGGGEPGNAGVPDTGTVFTCEFTDVPVGSDATPVAPGGVVPGAVGSDGGAVVASGTAVIAGSGTIGEVPPAGLTPIDPAPSGADVLQLPELSEARQGTPEECAAVRPASVPAPPR